MKTIEERILLVRESIEISKDGVKFAVNTNCEANLLWWARRLTHAVDRLIELEDKTTKK